jgi:hypothetical protein
MQSPSENVKDGGNKEKDILGRAKHAPLSDGGIINA